MRFVVSNEQLVLFKSFVLLTVYSFLQLHKKNERRVAKVEIIVNLKR